MKVSLGQVVFSKAGRDAGRKFIIVEIVDELYVLVADGDLRRLEKAKRKKVKHLELTDEVVTFINEKLKNSMRVSNSELRKALSEIHEVENKSEV
jgi:ribosomal protein L14E/L6E/L27E